MNNEHEDNDGIDDARRSGRNKDSGDKARGVQVANPSEIGLGTPDCGMEQGRADAPQVDGTGEGAQQVAFQWRSAPLPTVDEFAGDGIRVPVVQSFGGRVFDGVHEP